MATFRLPGRSGSEDTAPTEKPKTQLEQRREELRTRFTEMQWDLGGAAYEMAARDYFRLDVLASMAAKLQIVDAELAEIERITRLEQAGASGACAGCGSLHARGAIYCWRCGRNVAQPQGSAVVLPAGTARTPIEAGSAGNGHRPVDAGANLAGDGDLSPAPGRSSAVVDSTISSPEAPPPNGSTSE